MQYIDKTIPELKKKAHDILKMFIDGQWQDDAQSYINLTYTDFDNKLMLSRLLLKEQNNFCCYCMKHIIENETTLEHIIPNKSNNSGDFDIYKAYNQIDTFVFFWERAMCTNRISVPPFPHILAYENLVASCNGYIPTAGLSKCCNNIRGSKEIIPLFCLANVEQELKYELSGAIDCAEKYFNTIKILALEQTTLRLFRRCWLNLSSNYSALDVIDASKDEKLRDKIIDDMNFEYVSVSDRMTIKNEVYWKSFMNYFWFYLYKQKNGL